MHIAFICVMLTSCNKNVCSDGDGFPISTLRNIIEFSAIDANLSAVIELIEDPNTNTPFVELIAEDNIQSNISTQVIDDTLYISLGACFENHADIIIRVHYHTLNAITTSGPSDIISNTIINQDKLTLNIKSSGNINLTTNIKQLTSNVLGRGSISLNGEINYHLINQTGAGSINSYQAPTDSLVINISGTGNSFLRVRQHLTANIFSDADVYYKGNPTIISNITGMGRVINAN